MQKFYTVLFTLGLLLSLQLISAQSVSYNPDRGYYTSTQNVTLTTNLPGAIIKYTTNGTLPTPSTGLTYNSPISVSTTTTIATIAYNSLDTTNIKTHTYLFLADVISQPNSVAGFPTTGFAFDASITANPTYAAQLDTALKQIPSMCITLDLNDFNDVHNDTLEAIVSLEIINGDGSNGEQITAGFKRVGTASLNSPKRTFRLNFKSEFGASKLSYKLMGDNAADEFDQIQLRPGFYNVINGGGSTGGNDIYDQFVRNLQEDIQDDNIALHGTFVHLYINGVYWGVYNPTERGTDNFASKYYDGKKSNWDAIKGGEARSGNDTIWNEMNTFANTQDFTIQANYDSIQKLVEIEQFTDYVLLTNFAPHGNHDAIADNSFATRHRNREDGFRFWIWNTEEPPSSANIFNTGAGPFENIYSALFTNDDYKILLADRFQCNCFDEGNLTPTKTIAAYEEIYNAVELAFIAEAARWATATEYVNFQNKATDIINNFLPNRTSATINNYTTAGLLPSLNAVEFSETSGLVTSGTTLTLTNPNGIGDIYYTLDGTDPRLPGGNLDIANAILYTGPISLNAIYNINARVMNGTDWSGSCPKLFYVPQNYSDLVINEIHYNPLDEVIGNDTIDGTDLEFVEIYNNGTEAIDLTGVKMTDGGDFNFPAGFVIDTAEFVVIAKDDIRFALFYGLTPNGDYEGNLSNKGEDVVLKDPFNNIIDSVRYDDKLPWKEEADGTGPSLALEDYDFDNTLSGSWDIQKFEYTPFEPNNFCDLGIFCSTVSPPSACGANNGLIFCNGSNGAPGPGGYQYIWNTGITIGGAGNLSDGIYIITVIDSENCTATETIVFNDPVDFNATLSIDTPTYAVTAIPSGNPADYTYLWSDGTTTQTASNLPVGFATVEITDANGCDNWLYLDIPERDCPSNLTVQNPIDQSVYQVSDYIISDGQINLKDVNYKAGNYILLLNNFEALSNFNFIAEIDPCQ